MQGETAPPMSQDRWYQPDLEANTPPLRARTRILWGGRRFVAWRDTHPKTRRRCWAVELGDGIVEYWPPKASGRNPASGGWPRSFRDMGDEPELWQPRDPENWEYPLPEPVTAAAQGRFHSTRGSGRYIGGASDAQVLPEASRMGHPRYAAMSAQADASDAARAEIEAAVGFTLDDLARDRAQSASEADRIEPRWWRDSSLVTYSPSGVVSMGEAEARVLRAILTDGLRPWKRGEPVRAWPQEFLDWADAQKKMAEDPKADIRERFVPTRDDIRDSLVAMTWFAALDPPQLRPDGYGTINQDFTRDQVLLILRALEPPFTWRQIGRHQLIGCSHTQARKHYREAVERVWRAANGLQVFKHVRVRDELAALKERNRAHKRSQAGV